jgi:phage protein U
MADLPSGRLVGGFGYKYPFVVSSEAIHTFRSGSRERGAQFARHEVIGQKARLEPTRTDLDEITLEVVLDQALGVPPSLVAYMLNQIKELHETWPLFIGPYPMGEFVIVRISEGWDTFGRLGAIERMTVSITFLENADGKLTARAKAAAKSAWGRVTSGLG